MKSSIVTALSRFPALFVIASASSLTYRGDSRGQGKIAAELGVRYLLEGSVRRSGARVRIAVKLADALEGAQIWAERFDGDLDDVFALQDDVASAVAGQIAPTIEAADTRRAHARPTSDLSAYELYLRAVHRERDFDEQALQETIALLDQALALDPNFARALAFNPRILILDEATSSVDTDTELRIRGALERMVDGRTSVLIAHRLSTVQRADEILVMHKGQLRERGTHQQLLAERGLYWKLYQLQYRDQEIDGNGGSLAPLSAD